MMGTFLTRLRVLVIVAGLATIVPVVPGVSANDPLRTSQWGLDQIRITDAHLASTGAGATIAIVDSGIDLDHPDLGANVAGGVTFAGCGQTANGCGDGDWTSNDDEPSGHGTHVAGIAAAVADNGIGVVGVAPDARLLSVKVLRTNEDGDVAGTTTEIAAGIRWAVANGADVINMSLAAGPESGVFSITGSFQEISDAIAEATAAGVVVVAAAGNNSGPTCAEPAFDPQVICVVATDRFEQRAAYSNFAVQSSLNVVAAPGGQGGVFCDEDIVSTYPVGHSSVCTLPLSYEFLAGTSMAAPHVSGLAALLAAQGRGLDEIVATIRDTARTPGSGARGNYTTTYGYGIIDAAEAVGEPVAVPSIVDRHAGADRIATAAAVSRETYSAAPVVVIATAFAYADALAGAPFANLVGGPLLLSGRDGLSSATATEVSRLGAGKAFLLGGEAALSTKVAQDLRDLGLTVERIGGSNRFDTAGLIFDRFEAAGEVFITQGIDADPARGWPDALSASGLASALQRPILLVRTDSLPDETARRLGSDRDAIIVGGNAAVSSSVQAAIGARSGSVRRISGADRYATSAEVAAEAESRGISPARTWVATGRAFADGLVAGAAAGAGEAPAIFLLVDGQGLSGSPAARAYFSSHTGFTSVDLVGGVSAVSRAVEDEIRRLVED